MLKVVEVPDEYVSDYRCQCGGKIIEGTNHPHGDYDDWLEKPRCEKCGKESSSDKRPFEDFCPVDAEPVKAARSTTGGYLGVFNAQATERQLLKRFSRIDGVEFGPIIHPVEGESEYEYNQRAYKAMAEMMFYLFYDNGTGYYDCASSHNTLECAIEAANSGWQTHQLIATDPDGKDVIWSSQ